MRVRKERKGMHMASRFERKFRMVAVCALAIAALAASPALAGGKTTTTSYRCAAAPNPVTNVSTYTVSGSGFPPGMVVNVYIKDKISTWIVSGTALDAVTRMPVGTVAAGGTFSIANINSFIFYPSDLGTKTVSVVNAYDRRTTTLCQCTFSVR